MKVVSLSETFPCLVHTMRVHLIRPDVVRSFYSSVMGQRAFERWLHLVKYADWKSPNDIKGTFPSADLLGKSSKRVVFNVGGNEWRVICKYHFTKSKVILYVKWVGHHKMYTRLCNSGRQYTIDDY
jgi:mRNA interferase HigB